MDGERRLGPYRLLRELGAGGMGVVWLAEDPSGARYAVKTLRAEDARQLDAIRREISILARMRAPGVVRVVGHGESDGRPWLAMELVDGAPLAAGAGAVATGGLTFDVEESRLPIGASGEAGSVEESLGLLREIAAILSRVHAAGVVHGDLKPENVLRRADTADGVRLVLVDFGISARFGAGARETLTLGRRAVGSLAWMAPEQIRGEPFDARADLYALGCLATFLLSGSPPFVGDPEVVRSAHLWREPEPLWGRVEGVSRELSGLVAALLAKAPEDRPDGADRVVALLDAWGAPRFGGDATPATIPFRPRLRGRTAEVDAASRRAAEAGVVLAVGRPGSGKTRWLSEVAARLPRGAAVVGGGCDGPGAGPLGPWIGPESPQAQAVTARPARIAAWRDRIEAIRAERPAFLLLDDIDESSILCGLAADVARSPGRVSVVATASAVPPELDGLPGVHVVSLGALDDAARREIVADMLGGAHAEVAGAGGDAALAVGSTWLAIEEGALARRDGEWTREGPFSPPPDIPQLARRRVARLPAEARGLAERAAVFGLRCPRSWLGASDDDLAALELLLRVAILQEDDAGVRFVHAALRDAVLDGMDRERRARLHVEAAALAATTLERARHLDEAGDPRAGGAWLEALVAQQAIDPRASGPIWERWRATVPDPSAPDRVRAARAMAWCWPQTEAGNPERHRALREAADLAVSSGDPGSACAILLGLGAALRECGALEAAVAVHEEALRLGRSAGADEERRALVGLGVLLRVLGRADESRAVLVDAAPRARQAGAHHDLAVAEANLGLLALAEPEAARRHLLAAAEAARVAGSANIQLRVLGNLAIVEWRLGRYDEAVARHRDTLALARRAADLDTQAVALGNLSAAARWLGRADEALATAEEAAALAARLGAWPLLESMRHARAEILASAGRLSEATAELDRFEPRTRSGEIWHAIRRADVAVRAGLPEEGRRHLARAEALLESPGNASTEGDPGREIAALRAASDAAGS